MKWSTKSFDGTAEQDIIKGLILSNQFAKEIIPILKKEHFVGDHTRILSEWCIGYFKKYDHAPGDTIRDIWEAEKKTLSDSTNDAIGILLESIEEHEQEKYNLQYELDKAEHYLKKRAIETLRAELYTDLERDNAAAAEAKVAKFSRAERYTEESIDVFGKAETVTMALMNDDTEEELFSLPGIVGEFIGPFCRGDLYAVAGSGKKGKSWWLQEMGMRAVYTGLKVLFISLEMQKYKMVKRIYQHILGETRKPLKDDEYITIPYFHDDNSIQYRKTKKEGLQLDKALKKRKDIHKLIRGGMFRLQCFPAYSVSIDEIETHIDNLEYYHQFTPDVIIVDYADIVRPDSVKMEPRQQIDHIWKSLRSIAQKRNCVVITASHTGRATYSRDVEQGDLSDDIRKLNHVAGMFSLNQDKDDKKKGIMRIKMMAARHDSFHSDDQVIVLQNLAIGKPYLDSRYKEDVKV